MDAIEQMMKRRADELQQIVGGTVSLHCDLTRSQRSTPSEWFRWWALGTDGNHAQYCINDQSFVALKQRLLKQVDEMKQINATSQQQAALNEILLSL